MTAATIVVAANVFRVYDMPDIWTYLLLSSSAQLTEVYLSHYLHIHTRKLKLKEIM